MLHCLPSSPCPAGIPLLLPADAAEATGVLVCLVSSLRGPTVTRVRTMCTYLTLFCRCELSIRVIPLVLMNGNIRQPDPDTFFNLTDSNPTKQARAKYFSLVYQKQRQRPGQDPGGPGHRPLLQQQTQPLIYCIELAQISRQSITATIAAAIDPIRLP